MKNLSRCVLAICFLGLKTDYLSAQAGILDSTFATNGIFQFDKFKSDEIHGMSIQPDGKILAVGLTKDSDDYYHYYLFRLTQNGTIDSSFGTDGFVNLRIILNQLGQENPLVDDQGRILVVGDTFYNASGNFAVQRFLTDGIIDSSFGINGTSIIDFGTTNDHATSIAFDSSQRIIVGGYSDTFLWEPAVARLNEDGQLDASFSDDGLLQFYPNGEAAQINDVVVQSDNKIILAGAVYHSSQHRILLARLEENGSFDNDFATNGIGDLGIGTFFAEYASGVLIGPNGDIIFAGSYQDNYGPGFFIAKTDSAGTIDASFNNNMGYFTTFCCSYDYYNDAFSVILQPDQKIVAAGKAYHEFSSVRVNYDGTWDDSYQKDGQEGINEDVGPYDDESWVIAQQENGKILIGGMISTSDLYNSNFGIIQYKSDGTPLISQELTNTNKKEILIFPNPTDGTFKLQYNLSNSGQIRIDLLSSQNSQIHSLFEGFQNSGTQNLLSKIPRDVAGGVYLLRIYSENEMESAKLIYLK